MVGINDAEALAVTDGLGLAVGDDNGDTLGVGEGVGVGGGGIKFSQ